MAKEIVMKPVLLITGASRGIGAAAYALLKKHVQKVVGHSTKGSDALIAGDLADPAAPRDIWDTALDELGGEIDVLVKNAGKVLTHRQLLKEVWGPGSGNESHYLRVYMNQLRQKLEADPARPKYLLTEPGVGYRLVAEG